MNRSEKQLAITGILGTAIGLLGIWADNSCQIENSFVLTLTQTSGVLGVIALVVLGIKLTWLFFKKFLYTVFCVSTKAMQDAKQSGKKKRNNEG